MRKQISDFLAKTDPFTFLLEEEIVKMAEQIKIVNYTKDTVLFVQGQSRVENLYIIFKGAAERYFEEKNNKKLIGVLSEGSLYGGISILINNGVAVRTLRLTEDSFLYELPGEIFLDACQRFEAFSEYFTDTFGKHMLDRSYAAVIAQARQSETEGIDFFSRPLSGLFTRNLITCDMETSVRKAAEIMSLNHCSAVFVTGGNGQIKGIVTDNDLRNKVVAKGLDIRIPVSMIMSGSVVSLSEQALVFEALMAMMESHIKHLAITDGQGRIIGIMSDRDVLRAHGQLPFFLMREIATADSLEIISAKRKRLPELVRHLINSGVKAGNVTRFVTSISDTILEKLAGFAFEELGPPPCRFAFMIMGSEGRQEQTLKTDQDNAIVFEDVDDDKSDDVRDYFLAFGEKVCALLNSTGYAFCKGDVMAKNPRWCQPMSVWKDYFKSWIHEAEAEDLLQASIFFDFRHGYGNKELVEELRSFLTGSLVGWVGFFRHLAENALHFKPPIGFFRNFVVESKGKHRNKFDIKSAMVPIVDIARLYALKNNITETNTLERLHLLHVKNALSWQECNELQQAYSFLMQLRFVRQVSAVVDEGSNPDNYINPKKLSNIEQTMLKEIFKRTEKSL